MGTLLRRQESGSTNSSGIYEENAAKNSGNFGLVRRIAKARNGPWPNILNNEKVFTVF